MENSDFQNMIFNFLHRKGFDDIITKFMMSSKVQEIANERWMMFQHDLNGIQYSAIEAHYGSMNEETIRTVLASYTYEMYLADLHFGAQMMVFGMIQSLLALGDLMQEEEVINVVKRGLIEETPTMLNGITTINDVLLKGTIHDAASISVPSQIINIGRYGFC